MEYMFIETLNNHIATDRIEELCGHYNMDHEDAGYTDFATLVTKVPADFPVDEIEHENWFFGYDIKEDYLYYKAKTYLASGQFDKMTLSVKALDLSILGVDTDALDVNTEGMF